MSSPYRVDLQGLRAVAVLLVALAHAGVGFLRGGFVGVDVFFVLSGFLITSILLAEAERTGSVSLTRFYARRARRIVPAAALTLAATFVATGLLLNFVRAREAVWDGLYAAGFAANIRFADHQTDYFADGRPPSPVLHFWSLSVEEQFYLVWPALLVLVLLAGAIAGRRAVSVRRVPLLVVVAAIGGASFAVSVHETERLAAAAYFSPLTRGWELALGAALAVAAPRLARLSPTGGVALGWLGLLAIGVAATSFSQATPFPGYAALLPTVGAALVIWGGMTAARRSPLAPGRLLALAPLRAVGDRSYAFYLWHWPVLVIATQYAEEDLPLAANLVLLAVAFGISVVSYALVENPIRRARWGTARSAALTASAFALVAVTAAVSLEAAARKEARLTAVVPLGPEQIVPVALDGPSADSGRDGRVLPAVADAVRQAKRDGPIPTGLWPPVGDLPDEPNVFTLPAGCVPVARSSQSSSRLCPVGTVRSRLTLVLVGDSHAQMWLPAVARAALRNGWRVIPVLRPGCTPDTWTRARGLAACRPWYRWARAQIARLRPRLVVVAGAFLATESAPARAAVRAGIGMMARTVGRSGQRVVVLGDPEGLERSPVDCLLSRNASMGRCTATWSRLRRAQYGGVARSARASRARFLDTRGWFCSGAHCPPVVGRTVVYRDFRHVTGAYALRLAGALGAPLRAELRRPAAQPRRSSQA